MKVKLLCTFQEKKKRGIRWACINSLNALKLYQVVNNEDIQSVSMINKLLN